MPPSIDPEPPQTQEQTMLGGRYLLGAVLGRGGMADVHRATDVMLDRAVAVKVLRETADDPGERARFVGEARTLARLTHPGLVTLLDAGLEAERPYLVMDLVTGGTLRDLCHGPRVDRGWAAGIGAQIADALAAVHAAGVVHRDIKPGNVLLDGDRTRLADFGIARLLSDSARHTRTGVAIGTAAYLAPEQVTGDSVTTSADVYSLGLVLLELLTGKRAYAGAPVEAAVARLHQPPELPVDLSVGWQSLLREMTALAPGDRPTAAEAALRLRVIAEAYAAADAQVQTAPFDPGNLADTSAGDATPVAGPKPRLIAHARQLAEASPLAAVFVVAAGIAAVVALGVGTVGLIAPDETAAATTIEQGPVPSDDIPSGVPERLREPLADLHRAVDR